MLYNSATGLSFKNASGTRIWIRSFAGFGITWMSISLGSSEIETFWTQKEMESESVNSPPVPRETPESLNNVKEPLPLKKPQQIPSP